MTTRRLFVSIDLPEELTAAVDSVQRPFRELSGVRPTEPEQAHVTMKFLGDVPDERVSGVTALMEEAIEQVDSAPFEATIEGIGVFPSFDYISVVWLGVRDGATDMTRLHEALETAFVDAGYDEEQHDFTPHVTIARVDHAGSKERIQELVAEGDPTVGSFRVDSLQLKESHLRSDGPEYETIGSVAL